MKQRLQNYGLWLAVASFVYLNLQLFGVNIGLEQYNEYVNGLLSILVIAGILNNPSIGKGYSDKQ